MPNSESVPLDCVFTKDYSKRITAKMSECCPGTEFSFPLYGGEGDFLGQLSRLLILCNESPDLKDYVVEANRRIGKLNLDADYIKDNQYIRCLRNSVLHGLFKYEIDVDDWKATKIIFLDVNKYAKKVTGKMVVTTEQLAGIMNIVKEVYVKYLAEIGWMID